MRQFMRQSLLAVAAATLALGFLAGAPTVHAEPRCTWDVPGTYGGWTSLPLMCPPGADLQPCQAYVPRP